VKYLRLSYSSISTYQNCPLSYKFRYIDRLPTRRTPQLSFGTSLHAVLAFFYENVSEKAVSLDALLDYLPRFWESDGYSDLSEEQSYLQRAKKVLTQFYHSNVEQFQMPFALEHKFVIELDCCTLSGVIDRVDRLPNDGLEIIDYKTSRKVPPKSKIHSDLQLSIYHLACEELWGAEPERLSLYFLIPDMKISTKRTRHDIKNTKSIIAGVCENIDAQRFEPRQNPLCSWCDFQTLCPNQKGNAGVGTRSLSEQTDTRIEDIISDFFAAKRKLESYQARLAELEKIIHSYCEKQKINSLNSAAGAIIRNKRIVQSYNINKLRDVLEPEGLWEQISTVDSKRLKTMVNREDLDPNIREQISSAMEAETEEYGLLAKESDQDSPPPQNKEIRR
jgi:putative RecB family exonuclease